jgi:predicted acylesterase/phospholipase RssA
VSDAPYLQHEWIERRRALDRLEAKLVRAHLAHPDEDAQPVVDALRYAISLAKLGEVQNRDGQVVDVSELTGYHSKFVKEALESRLNRFESPWELVRDVPDLLERTRRARKSILTHCALDRDSLEHEICTRSLLVVSGGGGGAGYVYPGSYEELERNGLLPDLMVGTSIGALMSLFRARRRRHDTAPLVAASKRLAWSKVFRVLEAENRYGLPASLRLYLHNALGNLFQNDDGEPLKICETEIPMFSVVTGITVDALKHDLDYYEHLIETEMKTGGIRSGIKAVFKVVGMLREFLSRRDALREIVIGKTPGTENFDALDAAGFSAAIPGVIHYDVLREAPEMARILDELYAEYGITRLGEGGMVANVPARIAWDAAMSGHLGRRNCFVLALDCFAPKTSKVWYPIQQAVRNGNVEANRPYMDAYITYSRLLSPMNLVPPIRDALQAISWGREAIRPEIPYIRTMMEPIPVLQEASSTD